MISRQRRLLMLCHLVLFLSAISTINIGASAANSVVNAASTVFGWIIGTDTIIERCRQFDTANATSYDDTYGKFHKRVETTIFRINSLLTEEARRASLDANAIPDMIHQLTKEAAQEADRMATTNPGTFMEMCSTIPKAVIVGTAPFQPLREKWPDEMRLIDSWH